VNEKQAEKMIRLLKSIDSHLDTICNVMGTSEELLQDIKIYN